MSTLVSSTLLVRNHVYETDDYIPVTGEFSIEESVSGWIWDKRIAPSQRTSSTQYKTYIPSVEFGLKDGLDLDDFHSGTSNGIKYLNLEKYPEDFGLGWNPKYSTGFYNTYWDYRPLFSDTSCSFNIDTSDNIDGRNNLTLLSGYISGSIDARIFKRQGAHVLTYLYIPLYDEEPESLDEANADRTPACWVEEDELVFRKDYSFLIGNQIDDDADIIRATWQVDYDGYPVGRTLYTNYFPVDRDSVQIISIAEDDTITVWEERDSLYTSQAGDQHYWVNYDLGIIYLGGYQAPSLILKTAIDVDDEVIEIYPEAAKLIQYGDQGVLTIGSEQIAYTFKTNNGFGGLTRGYNSTTAGSHIIGSTISDIVHGSGSTDIFYLSYRAVPRVEYEIKNTDKRSANAEPLLNVRAYANVDTNNIIQIISKEKNISEIILETDSSLIGGTLYGPLYYGTDISNLTARALDADGKPIDNIEITIELLNGTGYLNGTLTSYTSYSNNRGEIYSVYHAPYNEQDIHQIPTSIEHNGLDTIITLNTVLGTTDPSDIWLFQTLKHDSFNGTVGIKSTILEAGNAIAPWGSGYFIISGVYDELYKDGILFAIGDNDIKYRFVITNIYQELLDGALVTKIYVDEAPNGTVDFEEGIAYLLASDALEWTVGAGLPVIVYEWSSTAEHPLTGIPGAYAPLHPESITDYVLTYENRNLPLPEPTNDSSNLGGYTVIAPVEARFRAYARNPYSSGIVFSNTLRLRTQLSTRLIGVDNTGNLPIPNGIRLASEDFNIGVGIGGANFYTINPRSRYINSVTFGGVIL